MKTFREIMVVAILAVASISAFGQRRDQDKRPPKEPEKVVVPDKRQPPPPPQNTNRPKNDGKKKP